MAETICKHIRQPKYTLKWLENTHGELEERVTLFSYAEDRMQFVRDMLETGRLFELVEAKTTYLSNLQSRS